VLGLTLQLKLWSHFPLLSFGPYINLSSIHATLLTLNHEGLIVADFVSISLEKIIAGHGHFCTLFKGKEKKRILLLIIFIENKLKKNILNQ
jgi:hypothetical protein